MMMMMMMMMMTMMMMKQLLHFNKCHILTALKFKSIRVGSDFKRNLQISVNFRSNFASTLYHSICSSVLQTAFVIGRVININADADHISSEQAAESEIGLIIDNCCTYVYRHADAGRSFISPLQPRKSDVYINAS